MQSSHRVGLIVAAVVVLIVAFVVLGGGEDNTATGRLLAKLEVRPS